MLQLICLFQTVNRVHACTILAEIPSQQMTKCHYECTHPYSRFFLEKIITFQGLSKRKFAGKELKIKSKSSWRCLAPSCSIRRFGHINVGFVNENLLCLLSQHGSLLSKSHSNNFQKQNPYAHVIWHSILDPHDCLRERFVLMSVY